MGGRLTDDRIADLLELEREALAEARRCRDAITLIQKINKRRAAATANMASVRARVVAEQQPAAPKKKKTPAQSNYARQKAAKEAGTRPFDIIRRLIAEAPGPVAPADLTQHIVTVLAPPSQSKRKMTPEGNAARVVGFTLNRLVEEKQVKKTAAGYIPLASLKQSINGSGEAHD